MSSQTQLIRQGIQEAASTLDQTQVSAKQPPAFTYVPPTHARALDPEATLIEGMRGAGKSFWWSLLASSEHRKFVQECYPEAQLPSSIVVGQGFGTAFLNHSYPDPETLAELVQKFKPRIIWRAVVAVHAKFDGDFAKLKDWSQRVQWIHSNPEKFSVALDAADRRFQNSGLTLLVLFDALDRLADDWQHIRPLAKGLLQVALEVRSTKNIRCKVYVRPDMLRDEEITSFPDFSKLEAGKAILTWRRADLYALLFQCLGNASKGGLQLRTLARPLVAGGKSLASSAWKVPLGLRTDEDLQEALFEKLAGKAMGASTKRGKPYSWLVNHLQDSMDQVSPRSFFAALKAAAAETPEDDALPLNYRGIQFGVQQASQIRVKEIIEDYPWVKWVMEPLRGNLTVPCGARDIENIWKEEKTLSLLEVRLSKQGEAVKLPPQNLDFGAAGILGDLESLGMLERIDGKRVQMPDVYRVAFGFGRRGGVKPLK
ncbi:hypothetical protein [Sphaerotilus montanus]|uniref:hypothetical protein n=1 Tax=Sphaerotilus montanus TaxID=522889 RepID=UPI003FA2A640